MTRWFVGGIGVGVGLTLVAVAPTPMMALLVIPVALLTTLVSLVLVTCLSYARRIAMIELRAVAPAVHRTLTSVSILHRASRDPEFRAKVERHAEIIAIRDAELAEADIPVNEGEEE